MLAAHHLDFSSGLDCDTFVLSPLLQFTYQYSPSSVIYYNQTNKNNVIFRLPPTSWEAAVQAAASTSPRAAKGTLPPVLSLKPNKTSKLILKLFPVIPLIPSFFPMFLCGLFVAAAAFAAIAQGAAPPPTYDKQYFLSGTITLPYVNLVEPFQTYYDGVNNRQRIDYYNGMDSYVYRVSAMGCLYWCFEGVFHMITIVDSSFAASIGRVTWESPSRKTQKLITMPALKLMALWTS